MRETRRIAREAAKNLVRSKQWGLSLCMYSEYIIMKHCNGNLTPSYRYLRLESFIQRSCIHAELLFIQWNNQNSFLQGGDGTQFYKVRARLAIMEKHFKDAENIFMEQVKNISIALCLSGFFSFFQVLGVIGVLERFSTQKQWFQILDLV